MSGDVAELVAFVRARLDDDAQAARAASEAAGEEQWIGSQESGHPWRYEHQGVWGDREDGVASTAPEVAATGQEAVQSHIARHDPARVLAEVDAKRRIADLHSVVYREIGWLEDGQEEHDEIPVCGLCVPKHSHYQHREDVPEGPCLTVRLLALAWSDHPEYRPERAPGV